MGISACRDISQLVDDLNQQALGPEGLGLSCNLDLAITRGDLASLKQLNENVKSTVESTGRTYAIFASPLKQPLATLRHRDTSSSKDCQSRYRRICFAARYDGTMYCIS